ncbi:MAG: hypothetical protein GX558_06385, partial [Clostridiales bacterium]|nr:hypothetical protein [Clostridiales bacterium]
APDGMGSPIPEIGLCGAVKLVTANYAVVRSLAVDARRAGQGGRATANIRIEAHTAGKYTFQYALSNDDGMVAAFDFIERLPAAERTLTHALSIDAPLHAAGDYELRLAVLRAGVGCDTLRLPVAFPSGEPARLLIARQPTEPLSLADRARALGADGALWADAAPLPRAGRRGWAQTLPDAGGEGVRRHLVPAMPAPDWLEQLTGGEIAWPPGGAMWAQRGSAPIDLAGYEATFGPAVATDWMRLAALTRLVQAEATLDAALRARLDGAAVAFELAESFAQLCSPALIEWGDRPRPAYWALRAAWRPAVGFMLMPEGRFAPAGASIRLPVYLAADQGAEGVYSTTASAYAMDGALLADVTLPANARGVQKLGELALTMPSEGAVVLRTEARPAGGGDPIVTDQLLAAATGEHPMAMLLNPPRTAVVIEPDAARNTGDAVALMASGNGYGALLPGEARALPRPEGFEWLNRMR